MTTNKFRQIFATIASPIAISAYLLLAVSPVSSANASSLQNDDESIATTDAQSWQNHTIKRGDSLITIFRRSGLNPKGAITIANNPQGDIFSRIQPGQSISIQKNQHGELRQLRYQLSPLQTLAINADNDKNYSFSYINQEPKIRINHGKGIIDYSLFAAAQKSNIAPSTMYQFISLFGWQVDFAKEIRKNDKFAIVYEEQYINGEKIQNGEIIAAELILSGKKYQAIRYRHEDGTTEYYSPDGQSVKGAFLRTPMAFANVTSEFSKRRLHPIKKVWKAHTGVDYGAPRGTPIFATGNGRVKFVGIKGGYGKVIILSHGSKYETLYAHMSRYAQGIKTNARVQQGETIGYVGSTGLSTGPHLHYEFRVHGVHKNPLTVDLPKAEPIEEQHKQQFLLSAALWKNELEYIGREQNREENLAAN